MNAMPRLIVAVVLLLAAATARCQCYEFTSEGQSPTVITLDVSRAKHMEGGQITANGVPIKLPLGLWQNATTTLFRNGGTTRRMDGNLTLAMGGMGLTAGSAAGDGWSVAAVGVNLVPVNQLPRVMPDVPQWISAGMTVVENGQKFPLKIASIRACQRIYVFLGGFFDESYGHAVARYVPQVFDSQMPPNSKSYYWTWDRLTYGRAEVEKLLGNASPATQVYVIGHSYGGDTALQIVAECFHHVSMLVTVDPVGGRLDAGAPFPKVRRPPDPPPEPRPPDSVRLTALFSKAKQCMDYWLDIDAAPQSLDASDYVALAGGKYDVLPDAPVKFDDMFIRADGDHHADFQKMMQYGGEQGTTAEGLLTR